MRGFRLLGVPAFTVSGQLHPLPDTVPARLVALLALRGTAVSRVELAGILYPDEPESVARQRVRLQLSRARKLHPELPLKTSTHYVSCIAATDVHELQREVAERDWSRASARPAPELLAAWDLPAGLEAELAPLRHELTEAWLQAQRKNAHDLLARAEPEAAFAGLQRAIAQEPTAEDLLQLLLQTAGPAGRTGQAEQSYQEFRAAVAPFEPAAETRRLHAALLASGAEVLPDREQVIRAAAILGENSGPETVAEVINAPAGSVVTVLGELERDGLADSYGRLFDPGSVTASLAGVEQRYLHGQAARALSHAGKPLAEGEQWFLAGEYERAAEAWFPVTTGLFGREIGRQDEARAMYERILALPVRSPAWYAASAYYAGLQLQLQGAEAALARVEEVLRESADATARTTAFMVRASVELEQGKVAAAAESIRLAEIQVRATDSLALQRDVMLARIQSLSRLGETGTALKLVGDMIERLQLEPPRFALLSNLALQASLLCDLGDFDQALDSYREQLKLARTLGFRRDEVRVVADILATLNDMGRAGEEISLGLAALELGEFDVTWPLRFNVAEGLAALGRTDEAVAQLALIAAGDASSSIKGHALALNLRLLPPDDELVREALEFAEAAELVPVRVAIAASVAARAPQIPYERLERLLSDISPEKVPAWQAQDWQALEPVRQALLIRP